MGSPFIACSTAPFACSTLSVVDYRGEVLNYVGDEVIVTWPERDGAVDCRPLRCFLGDAG